VEVAAWCGDDGAAGRCQEAQSRKGSQGGGDRYALLKHDKDFDGGSARDEWTKREPTFKDNDTANDGFLSYKELRGECGGPEKTMVAPLPKENSKTCGGGKTTEALDDFTMSAIGRELECDRRSPIERGLFQMS
jgi:hypothetical protein